MLRGLSTAERIKAYIQPKPNSGCWIWTGKCSVGGYGQMKIARKWVYIHIYNYRTMHGEISERLELDHLCRVRPCVNPWHLEAVTHTENVRRGLGNRKNERTHCPRGHEYTLENTKLKRNRTSRECKTCHRFKMAERRERLKVNSACTHQTSP